MIQCRRASEYVAHDGTQQDRDHANLRKDMADDQPPLILNQITATMTMTTMTATAIHIIRHDESTSPAISLATAAANSVSEGGLYSASSWPSDLARRAFAFHRQSVALGWHLIRSDNPPGKDAGDWPYPDMHLSLVLVFSEVI